MSASNRAATIAQLQKVLKKHYQPVKAPADRTVLEHLLYACCLEDAQYEQADEAFARLQESYFDWNEVRVTTVAELGESMGCLPDPDSAASRLKSSLHSLFEIHYSFDLDFLIKENLGKAVQRLESYKGITPFVIAYVVQHGLGGHSIGLDQSALTLAQVIDLIGAKEAKAGNIPGLERAIPKSKGIEFSSMFHQLAVEYARNPFSPNARKIVLEIDSSAKDRFPKKGGKKDSEADGEEVADSKGAKKSATTKKTAKADTDKKSAASKSEAPKKAAKKKTKAATPTKKAAPKKSTTKAAKTSKPAKKKTATQSLARKKPR